MGCRDAVVGTTVKEPLGQRRLVRVTSQRVICMHGTRVRQGTPRADDSEIGCMSWHPSSHPVPVSLWQGSLTHWMTLSLGASVAKTCLQDA